jgi:hypothetical protein
LLTGQGEFMRSIRIPFLIDLKRADTKPDIRALSLDQRLDRDFKAQGPLVNRFLIGRINGALRFDGKPLPAVAPRGDAERARKQAALHQRLDPAKAPLWDEATLGRLVAAVRGTAGADTIGPACQQAVGRLFDPNYVGSAESFSAAQDLDDAVRTPNPVRWLALHATGRLRRSKRLLKERVGGDLAGVHGTGVAVHNIVRGLQTMRELWRDSPRLSPDEVLRACLYAPKTVLRQATSKGGTAVGDVRPGTLVLVELDKLRAVSPDAESVFMAGTWAECPAGAFVAALLRAAWVGAIASEAAEKRP